ncbi:D-alanine--D-alanine ligase [Deferribacterales bacterium RsTz2092]|nr:D-alanine--D-alanine ligase [Deferribacterales bacterium]
MSTLKVKKIFILYGGDSEEREVSLNSGAACYKALEDDGYKKLTLIDTKGDGILKVVKDKPDVCLLALHGGGGEDGTIQGFLDSLNIPYTGSGLVASALAFDKQITKIHFDACGISTPDWRMASDEDEQHLDELKDLLPVVVKPARGGSTIGLTIVKDIKDYMKAVKLAKKYSENVLVEEFIEGKELTFAVVCGSVLPAIWIKPVSGFYDYKSKYTKGATEYLFKLGIADKKLGELNDLALDAYDAVGCEGVARVDVIYTGKKAYVLEVNTIPGMTATSLVPKAAAEVGLSFAQLLEIMLKDALGRAKLR